MYRLYTAKDYERMSDPLRLWILFFVVFQGRHSLYTPNFEAPWVVHGTAICGFIIFKFYLFRLYHFKPNRLLTGGLFRFTRHPMYTGIAMMAVYIWWPNTTQDPRAWQLSLVMFIVVLCRAAYLQELETIARYGPEAERYYERTPRLFFMYPIMLIRRPKK